MAIQERYIGLDLDGTLVDYWPELADETAGRCVNMDAVLAVAHAVKVSGVGNRVAIITNQGGIAKGMTGKTRANGRPYPTAKHFVMRLEQATFALKRLGVEVQEVHASMYADGIDEEVIRSAAIDVMTLAKDKGLVCVGYVYEPARKPSGWMLGLAGVTEYWGDSPEDREAAEDAGVYFVPVKRCEVVI